MILSGRALRHEPRRSPPQGLLADLCKGAMKPFSAQLYELRRAAAAMHEQCASALDGVKAALPALSASDDPNTAIAAATATAALEVRAYMHAALPLLRADTPAAVSLWTAHSVWVCALRRSPCGWEHSASNDSTQRRACARVPALRSDESQACVLDGGSPRQLELRYSFRALFIWV
jgi:hypothetical protein